MKTAKAKAITAPATAAVSTVEPAMAATTTRLESYRAQHAAGNNAPKLPSLATKAIEEFRKMDLATLFKTLLGESKKASSAHVNGGKIIFVVAEKRPADSKQSLTQFITKETGESPHTHATMCAISFGMMGEGFGFVTEIEWDTTPLKWHLQVSAILNFMVKKETPAETVQSVREDVAKILRDKPSSGETMLKELKKALKGEATPEAGETDEEKQTALNAAATDLLCDVIYEALGMQIDGCDILDKLKYAGASLTALGTVATARYNDAIAKAANVPVEEVAVVENTAELAVA